MSELATSETFEDGQSVTAAKLNNAFATLAAQIALITARSAITPAVGDYFLFFDVSGNVLGKCTGTAFATALQGLTSSTLAAGNDSRFSAAVTGLRLGAGGGATDTAAKAKDLAFAPTNSVPTTGAVTLDCATHSLWTVPFSANTTITITNISDGDEICIQVTQDGTGSRLLTLATSQTVLYEGNAAYALSTAANSIDLLFFRRVGNNLLSWIRKDFGT